MSGALQTHGTCWLFSGLNQFILAYNMRKVVYHHMKLEYAKMTDAEKEFFNAYIEAPCPLSKNFNKVYFYKFLDQYVCFTGPAQLKKTKYKRGLIVGAGKSANLIKKLSPTQGVSRNVVNANAQSGENSKVPGLGGSYSLPEFMKVIKTLGITAKECIRVAVDTQPHLIAAEASKKLENHKNKELVVVHKHGMAYWHKYPVKPLQDGWDGEYPRVLNVDKTIFELSSACIHIETQVAPGKPHGSHVVAAYRDKDGNGFLFDSNQASTYIPCNWWVPAQLTVAVEKFVSPMYGPKCISVNIIFMCYVRESFSKNIDFTCRLAKPRAGPPPLAPPPPRVRPKFTFNMIGNKNSFTIKNYQLLNQANYNISPGTRRKILNLFRSRRNKNSPKTPNNNNKSNKPPSPPRKKKTPEVINLVTPPSQRRPAPRRVRFSASPRSAPRSAPRPSPRQIRLPVPVFNRPSPRASPMTLNKAKSAVAKMKTMKERKEYRKQRAANLNQNNWMELIRYINRLNWEKRNRLARARELKKQAKK